MPLNGQIRGPEWEKGLYLLIAFSVDIVVSLSIERRSEGRPGDMGWINGRAREERGGGVETGGTLELSTR